MSSQDWVEIILGVAILYLIGLAVVDLFDPHDWDDDHDGAY